MATIQSPGIGSGLDVNNIVESLVEAEGAPARQRLDSREARLQVQISALGALKSAASEFRSSLSSLKTTTTFNTRSISANQEGLVSLDAGTAAIPGTYNMKVLELAQAQKSATAGFASEGVAVGTGTLTVTVGEQSFDIEVDESNNTLAGLRDAINDALSGQGVSATLLNVDDPDDPDGGSHTRMLITSEKSGSDQEITFSVADDDGNNTDAGGLSALATDNLEVLSAAKDAVVEIEGLTVTSATNKLENVIDGVTIELTKADPDTEIEITVAEDHSEVTEAVNQFVEGYNALMTSIAGSDTFDTDTDTAGALLGDASVRAFKLALSRIMGTIDREAESS
ncbi:MAG: flagellar filament capping protein FliD, partial [Pseudomonadota bacterium]